MNRDEMIATANMLIRALEQCHDAELIDEIVTAVGCGYEIDCEDDE